MILGRRASLRAECQCRLGASLALPESRKAAYMILQLSSKSRRGLRGKSLDASP